MYGDIADLAQLLRNEEQLEAVAQANPRRRPATANRAYQRSEKRSQMAGVKRKHGSTKYGGRRTGIRGRARRGGSRTYGRKTYSYARKSTAKRARTTKTRPVYTRRVAAKKSSRARPAPASVLQKGTIVYEGNVNQSNWAYSLQGTNFTTGHVLPYLDYPPDVINTLYNLLARSLPLPGISASPPLALDYWYRSSIQIKTQNAHQVGCTCTVYKIVSRRDLSADISSGYQSISAVLANPNQFNGPVSSGALPSPDLTEYGTTPYQFTACTSFLRIVGKPKTYRLDAGQSMTLSMKGKWRRATVAKLNVEGSFANETMGFAMIYKADNISDHLTANLIQPGPGYVNQQWSLKMDWMVKNMNNHFYDYFADTGVISTFSIIQPQTGVLNMTPTHV